MRNRIRLNEEQLHRIIKESVNKILREGWYDDERLDPESTSYDPTDYNYDNDSWVDENAKESIYFTDLIQILDDNGWSIVGYQNVSSKDGEGVRYELSQDSKESTPFEQVVDQLKSAAINPNGVIPSCGEHRYAPEIKRCSVVVLYV